MFLANTLLRSGRIGVIMDKNVGDQICVICDNKIGDGQQFCSKCGHERWHHWNGPESVVLYCDDYRGTSWCLLFLIEEECYCVHSDKKDTDYEKFDTEADALIYLLEKCSKSFDLYEREQY